MPVCNKGIRNAGQNAENEQIYINKINNGAEMNKRAENPALRLY